jgi:hypothetical protein
MGNSLRHLSRSRQIALGALSLLPLLNLAGCGVGSIVHTTSGSLSLQGTVKGGQQPIVGSTIKLYAVGSGGNGLPASDFLNVPPLGLKFVLTDATGSFTITGDYTCPSADAQVYLTATGGNPGLTPTTVDNTAIALVAAFGPCGNLSKSTYVTINEATTAAAAWALAPFATSLTDIGATSTNPIGITNAFATANQLVDTSTGLAPTPAVDYTVIESAKVYSLANILASWVNSTGLDTACSGLFTDVTPPDGTQPTDTFGAALAIVKNPSNNVAKIYTNHTNAQAPFPGLAAAPNDWSLTITYRTDIGPLSQFTLEAFDPAGNLWGSTSDPDGSQFYLASFSRQLAPLVKSTGLYPYTDGNFYGGGPITIDASNNIWMANQTVDGPTTPYIPSGTIFEFGPTGNLISPTPGYEIGGIADPDVIAADSNGYVWVGNSGTYFANGGSVVHQGGGVTLYTGPGVSPSPSLGYANNMSFNPDQFTFDTRHTAWVTNYDAADIVSIAPPAAPGDPATIKFIDVGGEGIAADTDNDIWFTTPAPTSTIYASNLGWISGTTGNLVTSTLNPSSQLYAPVIAIDPSNRIWVENQNASGTNDNPPDFYTFYDPLSLSVFAGGKNGNGAPLSTVPLGLDANIYDPLSQTLLIDTSGNIWIPGDTYIIQANNKLIPFYPDAITMFVGLATPAKTPNLGIPVAP